MVSASSGDRSADQHHDQLRGSGDAQAGQADLDRPDTLGAGLQRGVDRVGRVVAVRAEDR